MIRWRTQEVYFCEIKLTVMLMDSKVLGSQSDDLMTNDKKRGGCKDCPYYRENTNVTTIRDYGKTETGFAGLCINPEYVKKLLCRKPQP